MFNTSWRQTFNFTFGLLAWVYVIFFLGTRVSLFVRAYSHASIEQQKHARFSNVCLTHADVRETEPERCSERQMLAEVSPLWIAVQQVAEKTHSCGEISCADLGLYVANRSGFAVLYFAVASAAFLVIYTVLSYAAWPMMMKAARQNLNYADEHRSQAIENAIIEHVPQQRQLHYIEDIPQQPLRQQNNYIYYHNEHKADMPFSGQEFLTNRRRHAAIAH